MTLPKHGPERRAGARPADARAEARAALDRTLAAFEGFQLRLMAAHAAEFATTDLTMAQAKLLYIVTAGGELTLTEIAARLNVSASTASGAVDHLVGLGMLTRSDDPANRRQVRVAATELGSRTLEQIRELGTRQLKALLEDLDDAALEAVERAIHILSDALESQPA